MILNIPFVFVILRKNTNYQLLSIYWFYRKKTNNSSSLKRYRDKRNNLHFISQSDCNLTLVDMKF